MGHQQISSQYIIEILKNCINDIYSKNYNNSLNISDVNVLILNKYNEYIKNQNIDITKIRKEQQFCVFTDGACNFNGKKNANAGYAVVFPNNREYDFSERLSNNPTNNRAEYLAIIKALEHANKIEPDNKETLYLYTDSELLINSVTKWIKGWKKNNWITSKKTPVLNKDLLVIIDNYLTKRKVVFTHVRAHTNNTDWESYWNNIVDTMAKNTIKNGIVNIKSSVNNEKSSFNNDYSNDKIIFDKKIRNILSQFGVI